MAAMLVRHCRTLRNLTGLLVTGIIMMGLLTLGSGPLIAQEVTGGITGIVTDSSGAAVPAASVTATDSARGTVWPTTTNSAGVYNFPRLPAGQYTVKATAKGFATTTKPSFELQMNQVARVDLQLQVGAVTQTVEVTGAPPLLQTETMQRGFVTNSNFNVNLPLATRNFIQLTLLAPGVTNVNPSSFVNGQRTGGGGRPYVNGNRKEANNFLLDGIDNNQTSDNLTSYQPSPDAIQEFNIITNNAPAQYGQFQGGVISTTIKSGTNEYHGDVFEFLRNDKLNANNWARNWQGLNKPGLRWNTYGGTIGGPIIKDKLFFFADYQGERLDNPPVTSKISVLTPAERNGDFSQLLAEKGIQLYNPCASFSGPCTSPANPGSSAPLPFTTANTGLSNNIIPTSMLDPVSQGLFSSGKYPGPTVQNPAGSPFPYPLQDNAFNTSSSQTQNDQGDAKIDYMANESNHIWGRYTQGFQTIPGTNSFPLFSQSFNNSPYHGAVLDWTRTFSPTLVMDARIGLNRIYLNNGASTAALGNFGTQIGIADANVHGPGLLALNFTNGLSNSLGASDSEQLFADTTLEPTVDFIFTKGHHEIHSGFQALRYIINTYYAGNNGKFGLMNYTGAYTSSGPGAPASAKGFSEADFLLGLPQVVGLGISAGTWGHRSWLFAPYVQDNWRIRTDLTLNLGLRWQYNQPFTEVHDRQANFGPISGTEYFAGQGNCPYSNCRALYNNYWNDWEPRIGFAWTPSFNKQTVVRGAYTISSFLEGTGTNLRLPLNPPFNSEFENDYTTGTSLYFPSSTSGQGLSVLASPANPFVKTNIRLWDPNVRPNATQQWNFSVEHQFPAQTLVSLAYVGQHGTHLMVPMPFFQKRLPGEAGCPAGGGVCGSPYLSGNPTLYNEIGQISGTNSNGNQRYDALQASITKRMTHGLQLQVSYTYSKTMTNSIGYYGDGGQAASNSAYWQNLYNMASEWGPSYFDTTHLFVTSYTYQLPFGKGKAYGSNWNSVTNGVLGGWELSGIISAHSGYPITITGPDNSGTKSRGAKANCIAPVTYSNGVGPGTSWFSTSSFTQALAGTFGTCSNGTVRGPGLGGWDLGVMKNFHISEAKYFQFRSEFLNFTNTPVFNAPNRSVTSSQFGQIRSSQGERNIQFALKFYF
ncbi:MAG: carboxypeptidase regulatory-like domain-containing protein [Acidobacteria bacterium]|nr:MAG: carboxypeptidase regulatory-like domain-containing protein [Acidobacteriota bacterium]